MKRLATLLILALLPFPLGAAWRTLEPGLDYEFLKETSAHVFRIDPKKFRIGLLLASDFSERALTAPEFKERGRAVLTVNGGFFDEAFRALGLLYRKGATLNPVRRSAWGIFAVSEAYVRILHRDDWTSQGVTDALQAGPRLVVDGAEPKFKEAGPSRRSAVGVTAEGMIEIAVAERPLLLEEWAKVMKRDCPNALNLDGGGSTQIAADVPDFSLKVEGLTPVPNALAVFRK